MSYLAIVVNVMIASPSDVTQERLAIRDVITRACACSLEIARWLIDVRSLALAAFEQAFFVHHLHLFECGAVTSVFSQSLVDFAYDARAGLPEEGQDAEFGVGGNRRGHSRIILRFIVVCQLGSAKAFLRQP